MPKPLLMFALALLAFAGPARHAAAMTFEVVNGPAECAQRSCILATGDIERDTAIEFKAFVREQKITAGALVVLDSLGGQLIPSLDLGDAIRQSGLATTVRSFDRKANQFKAGARCASACVYAFLGGVERTVGEGAKLGVHQMATAGDRWAMSAADGLSLMSMVATYVNRTCGNLNLLIPALRTPPQDVYWFSASELHRFSLVTNGAAA